ncbi:hypothetical protein C4D60_Mb05t02050 [Musa balbisiana]|uniref:Uncharacterized protein n=1 Tax=Musa balbisiana TaxID=52838 RepID=A0A4S8JT39_MUSBA|nr:hypothetical protein C4D60_Mb05t02050 [Musa balbisiana]
MTGTSWWQSCDFGAIKAHTLSGCIGPGSLRADSDRGGSGPSRAMTTPRFAWYRSDLGISPRSSIPSIWQSLYSIIDHAYDWRCVSKSSCSFFGELKTLKIIIQLLHQCIQMQNISNIEQSSSDQGILGPPKSCVQRTLFQSVSIIFKQTMEEAVYPIHRMIFHDHAVATHDLMQNISNIEQSSSDQGILGPPKSCVQRTLFQSVSIIFKQTMEEAVYPIHRILETSYQLHLKPN